MARSQIEETKKLMGALVRMKPKPHEEMKLGAKAVKNPVARKAKRRSLKKEARP